VDLGRTSLTVFNLRNIPNRRQAHMPNLPIIVRVVLSAAATLLFLSGCENVAQPTDSLGDRAQTVRTLQGSVTYRERMRVPPEAMVSVSLLDVSKMDVPAKVISSAEFPAAGGPPFAFALTYDAKQIEPGRTYSVSASIKLDGRLMFVTDTHHPADFSADAENELMLVRVGAGSPPPPDNPAHKPDASLTNTYWKLVTLQGEPVVTFAREPHLVLQDDGIVRGNLGCNTFSGGYEIGDGMLSFQGLRTTLMACPDGMEQETAISQALRKVVRMKITGDTLWLTDGEHNALITCEAVYLP